MRKLILFLLLVPVLGVAQTLSLSQAGSGNTATITVTSAGQFKLVWDAADNWGLSGWYDLVNDPTATTNLASPAYGVNGPSVPCGNQGALANLVFYSEGDEMGFSHYNDVSCPWSTAARSSTVITNTATLVVIETTSIPSINSRISTILTDTIRYYVYPNGKIYIHATISASGSITLGAGSWGNDMVMEVSLPNSLQTGTAPPDSQSVGWVRASTTQNPYSYTNYTEPFYFAYWGSSSGAYGFGSTMTPKASLLIIPGPAYGSNIKQAIHTWGCGTGCGVTRLGYNVLNSQSLAAGQSVSYDWLIQLGTQGSSSLPNMTVAPPTNCAVCSTIAMSYLANPTPPSGALLTGATPNSYTLPSGWTTYITQDFESGTFGTGAYGNGNFVTTQYHNDGNVAHTHSIECQVGGTLDCGGNVSWNKPLAVGTREVYLSFWEWLDSTFRMNDEMFLTRFWWNTGTGQPVFKEAILDYFQDSTLTYNSTDATQLWNMQGQPYYQNKLPSNMISDTTNFVFTTGSWVQHEIYVKFSTFAAAVSVPGTVTLNATAQTYTCASCNWTSLGVHIGDSPHFTGFTGDANNGGGASGGGGTSYFVQSMTPTVLTMSAMPYASNEGPNSAVTVQVDHADGAYQYYKNGALVAHQTAMIFPGGVDFSTQATNLSIGESYSKLIWHANTGTCQTVAPFTTACSTTISGCGYDNLSGINGVAQYGWNGSGLTSTTSGGAWNTHIPCDATWGGPMPTPPVFKRYLDDIIVLTKANGGSPSVPANRSFGPTRVTGGAGIEIR